MEPVAIQALLIFLSVIYVGLGILIYWIMKKYKEELHDPSIPIITAVFWPLLVGFGTALTIQDLITGKKKIKW